jgi:hypothetical protein
MLPSFTPGIRQSEVSSVALEAVDAAAVGQAGSFCSFEEAKHAAVAENSNTAAAKAPRFQLRNLLCFNAKQISLPHK